jgi:hypothetical protein
MTIGPFMLLIVAPALRLLFLSGEDTAGRNGDDVAHLQRHDEVDDI